MQEPDTKPGDYFVSVLDGRRYALALGPFRNDHASALARVDEVRHYAHGHGGEWAWFWAFGTCRLDPGSGRVGKLNEELGFKAL